MLKTRIFVHFRKSIHKEFSSLAHKRFILELHIKIKYRQIERPPISVSRNKPKELKEFSFLDFLNIFSVLTKPLFVCFLITKQKFINSFYQINLISFISYDPNRSQNQKQSGKPLLPIRDDKNALSFIYSDLPHMVVRSADIYQELGPLRDVPSVPSLVCRYPIDCVFKHFLPILSLHILAPCEHIVFSQIYHW